MKKVVEILLWIWQVPQNLLGLILCLYYRRKIFISFKYRETMYRFVPELYGGGVSLGANVFVGAYYTTDSALYRHEYGHVRQSRILGPLYLLVIGLPSLLWAMVHRSGWKRSYYWFYTEKWADKLGGVKRTENFITLQ